MFNMFKKSNCQKFFTYKTRTLDITGLSSHIGKEELKGFDISVGQITIKPEFVKATDKLMELDMLQYTICLDINQLDKKDPVRGELLKELIKTKIEMLKLAQNPTVVNNNETKIEISNSKNMEKNQISNIKDNILNGNIKQALLDIQKIQDDDTLLMLTAEYNDLDKKIKRGELQSTDVIFIKYRNRLLEFLKDVENNATNI